MPIVFQERVIAMLLVGRKKSGNPFYPRDRNLLAIISCQAGIAIQNAKLYEAVRRNVAELEQRVEERTLRVKNMYEEQSKFLAEMSHEFQTPIAILKMNLKLLWEKVAGGKKA